MRTHGHRFRWAALATGIALAWPVAAAAAPPLPAAAPALPAATGWHVAVSTRTGFLLALAAPARHDVWALGTAIDRRNPARSPAFGLHWNGRSWARARFPSAVANTGIGCAGTTGPRDTWAFAGDALNGFDPVTAGALRLVNGRWQVKKIFPAGFVTGCLVESPTELWVFGSSHVGPGVGVWHLHGATWTHLAGLRFAIADASAISPSDVWAEGENDTGRPVVARWNGTRWIRNAKLAGALPRPSPSVSLFANGIIALLHRGVWLRVLISKIIAGKQHDSLIVLHWNGRTWRRIGRTDPGYFLPGAVRDGSGGLWSVIRPDRFGNLPAGVWHLVRGRWVRVPVRIAPCPGTPPFRLSAVRGSAAMLGLLVCPAPTSPFFVIATRSLR